MTARSLFGWIAAVLVLAALVTDDPGLAVVSVVVAGTVIMVTAWHRWGYHDDIHRTGGGGA